MPGVDRRLGNPALIASGLISTSTMTATVPVVRDAIDEPGESFAENVSKPVGASITDRDGESRGRRRRSAAAPG